MCTLPVTKLYYREVRCSFKLMLEDRSIDILAYNLETVLDEKLETIITRTTTNTRIEYSCAVTPQVRQTGNRLSGLAGTAYASLLA